MPATPASDDVDVGDQGAGSVVLDQVQADVAALQRSRTIDRWLIRGLAVVVVIALCVIAWLARSLDQRNESVASLTILVERQDCTDKVEARWEDHVGRVIDAAVAGDDAALEQARAQLAALGSQEEQIGRCPPD